MPESQNPEEPSPIEPKLKEWWYPVYEFMLHVVVGSILCVIVLAGAGLLSLFVDWLESLEVDPAIVYTGKFLEYALLLADVVLYIVFLCKTTWKAIKTI